MSHLSTLPFLRCDADKSSFTAFFYRISERVAIVRKALFSSGLIIDGTEAFLQSQTSSIRLKAYL